MSDDDPICPYCASRDDCHHVLLVVDTTFRNAEGGVLMEAFNQRWSGLTRADEDLDEGEAFSELLGLVGGLADAACETKIDDAPGWSSTLTTFFVESETRATAASKAFGSRPWFG